MKINMPVTDREVKVIPGKELVTKTDLKGRITYVNQAFIEISGFSEQELVGQNHNVVRHPDMPSAAFQDLWDTLKLGRPWCKLVKNRCKNGDYYWVKANVTPVYQNGQYCCHTSFSKINRDLVG
jgi:methyl-accepting chemotaxis protein